MISITQNQGGIFQGKLSISLCTILSLALVEEHYPRTGRIMFEVYFMFILYYVLQQSLQAPSIVAKISSSHFLTASLSGTANFVNTTLPRAVQIPHAESSKKLGRAAESNFDSFLPRQFALVHLIFPENSFPANDAGTVASVCLDVYIYAFCFLPFHDCKTAELKPSWAQFKQSMQHARKGFDRFLSRQHILDSKTAASYRSVDTAPFNTSHPDFQKAKDVAATKHWNNSEAI